MLLPENSSTSLIKILLKVSSPVHGTFFQKKQKKTATIADGDIVMKSFLYQSLILWLNKILVFHHITLLYTSSPHKHQHTNESLRCQTTRDVCSCIVIIAETAQTEKKGK